MADDSELAGLVGNIVFTGLYEHLGEAAQGIESCRDVIRCTLTQRGVGLPRHTRMIPELQWVMETLLNRFDADIPVSQQAASACLEAIPVIDQLHDTRDLFANCGHIYRDAADQDVWLALALILSGLSPALTYPSRAVLRIAFLNIRGQADIGDAMTNSTRSIASFIAAPITQTLIGPAHPATVVRHTARAIDTLESDFSVDGLHLAFGEWLKQVDDIRVWADNQMTPFMRQWWDNNLAAAHAGHSQAIAAFKNIEPSAMAILDSIRASLLRMADYLEEALAGAFDNHSTAIHRDRCREDITSLSANIKCILGELPA